MRKQKYISLLFIIFLTACVAATPNIVAKPTETEISLSSAIPTQTSMPSPTPTPTNPVGELVYHKANKTILYDWFSYIPKDLPRDRPAVIWITGIHGGVISDDYSKVTALSKNQAEKAIELAEFNKWVLLVPVIPRYISSGVYTVVLPKAVFSDKVGIMDRRPDEKVVLMIDEITKELKGDGYSVLGKVLISGFSAGGSFTQKFVLLHPERVLAAVSGHTGGALTLPIPIYEGYSLNWPVGIKDFENLTGKPFNAEEYNKVPQLIQIGDLDKNNGLVLIRNKELYTSSEVILLNKFGTTDPVRLQNQVGFLNKNGFSNIVFKLYPNVKHEFTIEMNVDAIKFLREKTGYQYTDENLRNAIVEPDVAEDLNPDNLNPPLSLPIKIDGYDTDWQNLPNVKSLLDDPTQPRTNKETPETDIVSLDVVEDPNYVVIRFKTNGKISKVKNKTAPGFFLDLDGDSKSPIFYYSDLGSTGFTDSGDPCEELSGNFFGDNAYYFGGGCPYKFISIPGMIWKYGDVLEVLIPKKSLESANDGRPFNVIPLEAEIWDSVGSKKLIDCTCHTDLYKGMDQFYPFLTP